MVTTTKKRKSTVGKKRFIGKPTGQIQERVQAVGPEHFGIVSVDCAKRRSKWMLCNFYGKVVIEPTTVDHTSGGLWVMTQRVAEACRAEGLTDSIVAVEMTGISHKPVQRAFRKAGFDTRIVHPFASNHYRRPLHPDEKTDDHDLEAIFHAAVKGYGLATLPVGEVYHSLQAVSRHRHNLVKQRSRLMVQMRRLLHQTMPGFADLFEDDKLFHKSIAHYASARAINGRAGLYPSRYQSDQVDHAELVRHQRRGPQRIGDLIIPLLIRLGVIGEELGVPSEETVESNTSEARGSD
jgi:transposase